MQYEKKKKFKYVFGLNKLVPLVFEKAKKLSLTGCEILMNVEN